jgi:prepilin-type N-terminal cleavage/methylation domain-containing protein
MHGFLSVRTQRLRLRSRGLTLIEFLFAISIMAFVALGVAGMFPAAMRSVVTGGQGTRANVLTMSMQEALRSERFDELLVAPTLTNLYLGYAGLDTRTYPTVCARLTDVALPRHQWVKLRWKCDLAADAAQVSGQGLPGGYGTVAVACINPSGTVVTVSPCPTDLRRVTVTVTWGGGGERSVSMVSNVIRPY